MQINSLLRERVMKRTAILCLLGLVVYAQDCTDIPPNDRCEAPPAPSSPLRSTSRIRLTPDRVVSGEVDTCPRDKCLNEPPNSSPFPCSAQVLFGNCDAEEMRGYCECACDRCDPDNPTTDRFCPSHCTDDLPPDNNQMTCLEHKVEGNCDADFMKGFCQCTCNTCPVLIDEDASVSTISVEARSMGEFASDVKSTTAEAIARVQAGDETPTAAAEQVSVAVAEAVATAVAETSIEASVQGGTAIGEANAQAESIAIATANATATAFAEAGEASTLVETATFATDIKVAIVNSTSQLVLNGTGDANVRNTAVSKAVAFVVSESTAKAFASIAGGRETTIAFTAAVATPDAECPPSCNDGPGQPGVTCAEEKNNNNCNADYLQGFCECTCGRCDTGTTVTVTSLVEIITSGESSSAGNAVGTALADGATTAVAEAISSAVAEGNAEAVSNAVAEALTGSGFPVSAYVESISGAIGSGDEAVVTAVADALAQANRAGSAEALSEAIGFALLQEDGQYAEAFVQALSKAVSDAGCESVASALTQAQATAEAQGDGEAFAAALGESEVAGCLGEPEIQTSPSPPPPEPSPEPPTAPDTTAPVMSTPTPEPSSEITPVPISVVEPSPETSPIPSPSPQPVQEVSSPPPFPPPSPVPVPEPTVDQAPTVTIEDTVSTILNKEVETSVQNLASLDIPSAIAALTQARQQGALCATLFPIMRQTSELLLDNTDFGESVLSESQLTVCLGNEQRDCVGSTKNDCCTDEHPELCQCTRFTNRCRNGLDEGRSAPRLGLYVYTDTTFDRLQCKCPLEL
eukprot:TRINITY_DN3171_c0_g1_i3.p1 TRINITY_DN3171_c0_g1~~TRINITY_DN3171_c0_g1_i3.p1  ORF type:complete len:807 (-),score=103.44 TRINITY_DN3171_c0_g1_i3:1198-3618(-)